MDARFELFERYTLPSVRAQLAGVEWILLVDKSTKLKYIKRLHSYPASILFCTISWLSELQEHLTYGYESHTLTTRLDNDDMLGEGLLAGVRQAAVFLGYFNVPNFFKLSHATGKRVRARHLASPMLSRLETCCSPGTVYAVEHGRAPIAGQLEEYSWTQVIHEGNKCNA